MRLTRIADAWQALAEYNPMWAILSTSHDLTQKHDRENFFASGLNEVAEAFERLAAAALTVSPTMAVDFGCGMGRVTQALAARFDQTVGIDIAPTMIALANKANNHATCSYVLNGRDDLSIVPTNSVSFLWSHLVLQHMPQKFSRRYIREFARVLAPGGVAMFQIPIARPSSFRRSIETALIPLLYPLIPRSGLRFVRRLIYRDLNDDGTKTIPSFPTAALRIYGLDVENVRRLVAAGGASVVAADANADVGLGWQSFRYIVVKQLE